MEEILYQLRLVGSLSHYSRGVFFTSHVVQDFFEQQYHYYHHFHQLFLAPLGLVVEWCHPTEWRTRTLLGGYTTPAVREFSGPLQTWPVDAGTSKPVVTRFRWFQFMFAKIQWKPSADFLDAAKKWLCQLCGYEPEAGLKSQESHEIQLGYISL